jgi:hypothetical protein
MSTALPMLKAGVNGIAPLPSGGHSYHIATASALLA